jgi:hypothetical protein
LQLRDGPLATTQQFQNAQPGRVAERLKELRLEAMQRLVGHGSYLMQQSLKL